MKFDEWWDSMRGATYQDAHSHEAAGRAWQAALDAAADVFASQAGQMQMSIEQRLLITVAQRIRSMKTLL